MINKRKKRVLALGLSLTLLLGLLPTTALAAEATLHGTIIDQAGLPISDLSIVLEDRDYMPTARTVTDNKGGYTFSGLPVQDYYLRISGQGYNTITRPVSGDWNRMDYMLERQNSLAHTINFDNGDVSMLRALESKNDGKVTASAEDDGAKITFHSDDQAETVFVDKIIQMENGTISMYVTPQGTATHFGLNLRATASGSRIYVGTFDNEGQFGWKYWNGDGSHFSEQTFNGPRMAAGVTRDISVTLQGEQVILFVDDIEVFNVHVDGLTTGTGYVGVSTQDHSGVSYLIDNIRVISHDLTVNTELLQTLYDANKDQTQDNYTDESWTVLQEALAQAKAALEHPTVVDVYAAYSALDAAVAGLTEKLDLSLLHDCYQSYRGHGNNGYTDKSWTAFQNALRDAETILNNGGVTQAEVDAAYKALQDAYAGLKKSGSDSDRPSATEQTVSKVKKAKDGDTVKLNLPASGNLSGGVLEAAAGKDVTLEIDAGNGATWIINGTDLPTGKLADLDLRVDTKANTIPVDVINALTGENKTMQLTLSHNGPFDFPLTLRLEVGKDSAGLFANLYYYKEAEKALAYQSTAKIGPDGSTDLPFTHASSYAVVIDKVSHASVELPFTDVGESDWFYEAVAYVHQKGLMNGTSATTFSPNSGTTRAMTAIILYRLEGSPSSPGEGGAFTDVPAYYADAVDWCAAQGLVTGYGGGRFGPDDPVTREQLVTLLYRYAQYKKWDVSVGENTNILSYTDAFDISEWAVPAFQWACGADIINGTTDQRLTPKAGATRAQLATVLLRLLKNT